MTRPVEGDMTPPPTAQSERTVARVLSERFDCGDVDPDTYARMVAGEVLDALNRQRSGAEGKIDDATRLRLLEDALRHRDWMRVMDVVEDMGGNWRAGQDGQHHG